MFKHWYSKIAPRDRAFVFTGILLILASSNFFTDTLNLAPWTLIAAVTFFGIAVFGVKEPLRLYQKVIIIFGALIIIALTAYLIFVAVTAPQLYEF